MKKILLILPVLLISLCALAAIDPQSETGRGILPGGKIQ